MCKKTAQSANFLIFPSTNIEIKFSMGCPGDLVILVVSTAFSVFIFLHRVPTLSATDLTCKTYVHVRSHAHTGKEKKTVCFANQQH